MFGFSPVKNRRVIGVKKSVFFQALRLLSCHCLIVFKLFSLLLQRFGNVWKRERGRVSF